MISLFLKNKLLKIIILPLLFLFFSLPTSVFAYYNQGETLNPPCAPGSLECEINPVLSIENGGIGITGVGTEGQILKIIGGIISWSQDSTSAFDLTAANTWTGIQTFSNNFNVGSSGLIINLNSNYLNGYTSDNLSYIKDVTDSTLIRSGTGPYTIALNMGSSNVWTGLQSFNGNVGIGITNSGYALSVLGNQAAGSVVSMTNISSTTGPTTSILRMNMGTVTGGGLDSSRFIQFYSGSTNDNNGTGVGNIRLNDAGVTYTSGNADLAEWTEVAESVSNGDIISSLATGNKKAVIGNLLLGVVTDTAAFIGNETTDLSGQAIVGMLGRVNTKVSTENGNILIGDPIAASSVAGVGMKQTKAGPTIGKALVSYSGIGVSRIAVQVVPGWYDPDPLLTLNSFSVGVSGDILDQYNTTVTRAGGFDGVKIKEATISKILTLNTDTISDLTGNGLTLSSGALILNMESSNVWTALQSFNGNINIGTTLSGGLLTINDPTAYTSAINITGYRGGESIAVIGQGGNRIGTFALKATNSNKVFLTGNGASFVNGGNFGVGTASPGYTLDVNGTGNFTTLAVGGTVLETTSGSLLYGNGLSFSNLNIGTSNQVLLSNGSNPTWMTIAGLGQTYTTGSGLNSPSTGVFALDLGSSNVWTALQTFNGKVGVGTSTPNNNSLMHLKSGSAGGSPYTQSQLLIESNETAGLTIWTPNTKEASITFSSNTHSYAGQIVYKHNFSGDAQSMIFKVDGQDALYLKKTGVGIGVVSPGFKLDVGGTGNFTTLAIGGTVLNTTIGSILYGNGLSFSNLNIGTSNQVLLSNGSNPTWMTIAGLGQTYTTGSGLNSPSTGVFALDLGSSNVWTALQTFNGTIKTNNIYVDDILLDDAVYSMNTGILSGGTLSINSGDNTLLNVAAGEALIVYLSDISDPKTYRINWNDQTINPNLAGTRSKWIGVKRLSDGSAQIVVQTSFTALEKRTIAIIGRCWGNGAATITDIGQYSNSAYGSAKTLEDLIYALGSINISGNVYTPNGANLLLNKSSGESFRFSASFDITPTSANIQTDTEKIGITSYNYHIQNRTYTENATAIDPLNYDLNGTKTTVPNNKFTAQRIYMFPKSDTTHVTYGQEIYSSLSECINGASSENVVLNSDILSGSVLRAWICVKQNTTILNNNNNAVIITASGLGSGGGESGDGSNSLSILTAAEITNTIDNLNFAQTWNWSTATTQDLMTINATALTTGVGIKMDIGTSTGAKYLSFVEGGTVQGSITNNAGNAVGFNTTSDERTKENIVDTEYSILDLMKINVRDFDYINDPNHKTVNGFIAQELQKIYPEAVSVGSDEVDENGNLTNPWGVDYGKLTPLLVKSIQDQQNNIDALDLRIGDTTITTNLATINNSINNINKSVTDINDKIIEIQAKLISTEAFSIGSTYIDFKMPIVFQKISEFVDKVIFKSDVEFQGTAIFNSNTAGYAKILVGQSSVDVTFDKPYQNEPIINATVKGIYNGLQYAIKNTSVNGFIILINPIQTEDIEFNWVATVVNDPKTYNSNSSVELVNLVSETIPDETLPIENIIEE